MSTSYHCPHCGERYAPFLTINWARRVRCSKCERQFQVSNEAFCNNCMLVFMVYSFPVFWIVATIVLHIVPLPDPEGINFWGRLGLGAIAAVILSCFFMGVGWIFGSLMESRRYDPKVKKRRRKERVACPACDELNDPDADECEHCGEEL